MERLMRRPARQERRCRWHGASRWSHPGEPRGLGEHGTPSPPAGRRLRHPGHLVATRKVREISRLELECERSRAEIAAAACAGESAVSGYLARAEEAGLTWEVAREMSDAERVPSAARPSVRTA
ncbi:hypothetical protein BE08_15565 [Sorangium cellulosum]|uniref:Uncharacterized protein n=1 Tax=Sorangium cellulosum TaxID=56 RepID=A0A150P002_SORCE|nr:hypothetical protein BE08_15565 [Sorangium cellulosum]